jgi:hypothetical protein
MHGIGEAPHMHEAARERDHSMAFNKAERHENQEELLEPDREQIEIFVEALFRHAGDQGHVHVRSFKEGTSQRFRFSEPSLKGGLPFLFDVAEDDARRAAQNPEPVVFCPPLAVFKDDKSAADDNVIAGLVLSVDCDQHPRQARAKLEAILGKATIVVRSGGVWVNGGDVEDKMHLHWRLAQPARDAERLRKLRQARDLAVQLVGGDASGKAICHPFRWPGSWHRKGEPRLCAIDPESCNPDVEIDLDTALAQLAAALDQEVPATNLPAASNDNKRCNRADLELGYNERVVRMVRAAVRAIPNDYPLNVPSRKRWIDLGIAIHYATDGQGFAIFDEWSQRSPKYDVADNTRKAWNGFKPRGDLGWVFLDWLASQVNRAWDLELFPNEGRGPVAKDANAANGGQPAPDADQQPNVEKVAKDTGVKPKQLPQDQLPPAYRHGEVSEELRKRRWSIKNLLLETGVGLVSGQWGTFKTFLALDIASSLLPGVNKEFFIDYRIKRRGGVLFIAAEGSASSIGLRFEVMLAHKLGRSIMDGDNPPQPFAWVNFQPRLLNKGAKELIAIAKREAAWMKEKHGVELVLIIVDTVAAAAAFQREDDAAQANMVMSALDQLSKATEAFVLGVDHFGKEVETGTRGSSAKEDRADVILAMVGKREVTGMVTDLRLGVRKVKEADNQGRVIAFRTEIVDCGVDEDGDQITSRIIHWLPEQPISTKTAGRPKQAHVLLLGAIERASHEPVTLDDGITVQAAKRKAVHEQYRKSLIESNAGADLTADTIKQRWKRALKAAFEDDLIRARTISGCDYLWAVGDAF